MQRVKDIERYLSKLYMRFFYYKVQIKPPVNLVFELLDYYNVTVPEKLRASTSPWLSLTFSFNDIFNIPLGLLEGGMAAI
jgi:hypothetical protein